MQERIMSIIAAIFRISFFIIFVILPFAASIAPVQGGELTDNVVPPTVAGTSIPSSNNYIFTGAAQTSIPIIVPPGRGEIAPSLALQYSSDRDNGWVGLGWDLDLGAIQRSTKYGVDYSADDYVVVMHGSLRELAARSDWGAGYYSVKIEGDFARYYLNPSTGGWEVTAKDGTTYFYGTTTDSRQDNANGIFKWCLDEVQDVNGNYLTVIYAKDQGEIYPERIDYTGHTGGLTPTNYVRFYLEDRPDQPVMYTSGFQVKTTKRLKTMEVVAGGSRIRAYKLSYTQSQGTARSLLFTVQQFGTDATIESGTVTGGSALPPITAYYPSGNENTTFAPFVPTTLASSGYGCLDYSCWRFAFADVNGDGKTDAIAYVPTVTTYNVHVALSNGDGTFAPAVSTTLTSNFDYMCWDFAFADVNGDGMADMIAGLIGISYDIDVGAKVQVALSNGDGTFAPFVPTTLGNPGSGYQCYIHAGDVRCWRFAFVDVNGDGKTDAIAYYVGHAALQARVALSTGDGHFAPFVEPYLQENGDYSAWSCAFADVNGDGKADAVAGCLLAGAKIRVALSNGDGTFQQPFVETILDTGGYGCYNDNTRCWRFAFADINGDGRVDAFAYFIGENFFQGRVALSTGDGHFTPFVEPYLQDNTDYVFWHCAFADVNGDGKTDLVAGIYNVNRNGDDLLLRVALSNGDGTFQQPFVEQTLGKIDYSTSAFAFVDVNGDGKTDIVTSLIGYEVSGAHLRVALSQYPLPSLMTSISNGRGATTNYTYTPSSAYQNNHLPFIVHTVSRITVDVNDDLGHQSSTAYTYQGGYYDFAEREFRGFEQVMATDEATGMVTETHYHQDYIFQGRVVWSLTKDATDAAAGRVDNTWEAVDYGGDRAFPYIAQTIATRYDEAGASLGGVTTAYTYDDDYGNILTEQKNTTDGYSSFSEMQYLNDTTNWIIGKPTKITVSGSGMVRETRMEYTADARRLLERKKRVHNGTEYTTFYEYDAYGNVTRTTDPRGYWMETQYDTDTHAFPHIITSLVTSPNITHQVTKTFDPGFGVVETEIDVNGQTTTYSYDVFGRETYVDYPDPSWKETIYHIEPGNHYVIVRASDAPETTTFFDNLGREIEGQIEAGGTTIITATQYDNAGRVEYKSLPFFAGGTTEYTHYEYDERSRLIRQTKPDATYRQIIYTGLQETVVDENGHSKTTTKDLLGRIKRVDEAIGGSAQYTYDIFDNLVQVVDPIGNQTIITYDDLGRKIAMSDPYMGNWGYDYDKVDNLVWQKNGREQEVVLQYDGLNRVIQKDYLTTNRQVVYDYDEARSGYYNKGRLTTVAVTTETPQIVTQYNYDEMGQQVAETRYIDSNAYDFSRTYDLAGRLATVTYPGCAQVDYAYYPIGDLYQVTKHGSSTPYALYEGYNAQGQVGQITYGNGTQSTYTYYAKTYRIQTMTTRDGANAVIQELSYGYDNAGNILSITDSLNSVNKTFVYDEVDRLTNAQASTADPARKYDLTYTYDLAGNMLAKTDNSNSGMGWQVIGQDSVGRPKRIDYDTAIADIGERHIEYDQDNMPTRIVFKGNETTLFYDGDNTRVKKVSNTGTVIYAGGLYEVRGGSAVLHVFGDGKRIVSIEGTATYYYHTDHLNSTTVVTDVNGNRVEELGYLPFGSLLYRNAYQGGQWSTVYRFTGQEYDAEFALYNYNARLYDSIMGRFIRPDSKVPRLYDPQSLNRYTYCRNNPLVYIDPEGLWSIPTIFIGPTFTLGWGPWGFTYGVGLAFSYDEGFGFYSYSGTSQGAAASASIEFGAYSGSMEGVSNIATFGVGPGSVGLITSDDFQKTGVVFSVSPLPGLEGSVSRPNTDFLSFIEIFTPPPQWDVSELPHWVIDAQYVGDSSLLPPYVRYLDAREFGLNTSNVLGIGGLNLPNFSFDLPDFSVPGMQYLMPDFGLGNNALMGNISDGNMGLSTSSEPTNSGGEGGDIYQGTVLCSELHRQGILPDKIYKADSQYAERLDPLLLEGYRFWASPLARCMSKSKLLTIILAPFIKCWAYNMAYKMGIEEKKNFVGSFLEYVGVPICRMIGKYIITENGENIELNSSNKKSNLSTRIKKEVLMMN